MVVRVASKSTLDNRKKVKMDGWINRGDLRLVNMRNVYKQSEGN